jgi:hypothetical protein
MNITVKITKENKDGSADAVVRFDKDGLETLVQWGFIAMLKEAINEYATADQIASRAKKSVAKKATIVAKKTTVKKKAK